MPSAALAALELGLQEVEDLQRANPTPVRLPSRPKVVRAINRASVVLLSSHLERYLRAVVDEAVSHVNAQGVAADRLPLMLRLQHSRQSAEDLALAQWTNREELLTRFAATDAWLWGGMPRGELAADRLLSGMVSPKPNSIKRLFEMWGIGDIFGAITRKAHVRGRLWMKVGELVDKRNNIAHGDTTVAATHNDIVGYLSATRRFCVRVDRAFSRALARTLGVPAPW